MVVEVKPDDYQVGDVYYGFYDMLIFTINLKPFLLDLNQPQMLREIIYVKKSHNESIKGIYLHS